MSAFIVSRNHIALLTEALYRYEVPLADGHPALWGQRLWDENVHSVQVRYHNEPLEDLPGPCDEVPFYYMVHAPMAHTKDLVRDVWTVLKALRCWKYQTSDYAECEAGTAWQAVDWLETHILKQLGMTLEQARQHPAYETAAWEID